MHRKLQRVLWIIEWACFALFCLLVAVHNLGPLTKHPVFAVGVLVAWILFFNEPFLEEDS
jgi:hypothetical protein